MNLLIKSVRIIDNNPQVQDKVVDIYIEGGIYKKIAVSISPTDCKKGTEVFNAERLCISAGWFDMRVNFREPGYEQKETIASGQRAAASGGFTGVALMPSVNPVLQTSADMEFVKTKSRNGLTDVFPLGALTVNREGKDITEMYDLKQGGAVGFTDDKRFIKDSGVMLRALQYANQIESPLIVFCDDTSLSGNTSSNESEVTTMLGLKGSPGVAEEIALLRDLSLCKYTGVGLHIAGITTKGAVEIIRQAKKGGMPVTCEVAAHHLVLTDDSLEEFDTNFKVKPPLRSKEDVAAICDALVDGTIDVVVSDHSPEDIESKHVEWDYASNGMIGLESFFGVMNAALSGEISLPQLIEKITVNPRNILRLPHVEIKEGEKANFTIFNPDVEWTFSENHLQSLSRNTPFIGYKMKGKAIAVGNNNQFQENR